MSTEVYDFGEVAMNEAKRRFDNAESDKRRISAMRTEIAEVLTNACTQALYARGVITSERLREKLTEIFETEL